ncbi:MAG: glycosyltransferase [Cyanobacteria bacterium SBC]|nr:glycosyltransferase [Cyanobacteria bacterium SBC]
MRSPRLPVVGYLLKTFPKLSETFVLNEILELERQGIRLHLFSLRQPRDRRVHPAVDRVRSPITYIPSLLPEFSIVNRNALVEAHVELAQRDTQRYLDVLHFHLDRSEDKTINEFLQAGYLALKLEQLGIAHLHVHFANIPAATAELAKQWCRVPYSITAHAKDIYLTDPATLNRRVADAEFLLTCTDYNRQFLENISTHRTPIYLAYHGIDLSLFRPSLSDSIQATSTTRDPHSEIPLILSVGRFCAKKGFSYLLGACHLLKQQGLRFRCAIVGYGPLQHDLEQSIERWNLEDVVQLIGPRTQNELLELYRQADIFALPCQITEDGDRDGIPNVLLEAMAMEIPVVTTDISGISELIHSMKNGILVPQKNVENLTEELRKLILDREFRIQIGRRGGQTIQQNFLLENNVRQVKKILLETLVKNSPIQFYKIKNLETARQ